MSDTRGRRRLGNLVLVIGVSGNLRGFSEDPKNIDNQSDDASVSGIDDASVSGIDDASVSADSFPYGFLQVRPPSPRPAVPQIEMGCSEECKALQQPLKALCYVVILPFDIVKNIFDCFFGCPGRPDAQQREAIEQAIQQEQRRAREDLPSWLQSLPGFLIDLLMCFCPWLIDLLMCFCPWLAIIGPSRNPN